LRVCSSDFPLESADLAAVDFAVHHKRRRGHGMPHISEASSCSLPLRPAGGIVAAIGFKTRRPRRISHGTWRLLEDFADQTIFAIDDRRYHQPRKVSG